MESPHDQRDLVTGQVLEAEAATKAVRPTLRQDSRTRAQDRIVQGALSAVATWGLDATIDQVADASGVSRRTVFRHFANHDELILAALSEIVQIGESKVPESPTPGSDIEAWLTASVLKMHEFSRSVIGRAFWDLYSDRLNSSPEVAEKIATAIPVRQGFAEAVAVSAWRALGGEGTPPTWVMDSFSLHISGFATNAFPSMSSDETARLSARILWLVLSSALSEQHRELA